MITAAAFYTTASGLFWLTVALAVVTIAGVIVAYVTLRSSIARRRLLCSVSSRSRLLGAPKSIRDELKIVYQEGSLDDPYVIALEIANVGRSAVQSDSFDKGRSIKFEIGAPIVRILSTEHVPSSAPDPEFVSNGNLLELRPELIVKDELIRTSLLTEGPVGDPRLALNPLGDVSIEVRDREVWQRKRSKRLAYVTVIAAALALGSVIAAVIALSVAKSNEAASLSATVAIAQGNACGSLELQDSSAELALLRVTGDVQVHQQKTGGPLQVTIIPGYPRDLDTFKLQADTFQTDAFNASGLGMNLTGPSQGYTLFLNAIDILSRIPKDPSSEQKYKDLLAALNDTNKLFPVFKEISDQCKRYTSSQT